MVNNMNIVYEDHDIVVVFKEANVMTQSDEKGQANLLDELSDYYKMPIYLIHRLDFQVSGLLVFAKSKKAAAILSETVSEHTKFMKEYHARVYGTLELKEGTLEDYIYKDAKQKKAYVVKNDRKGAKKAILDYKVVEEDNESSLLHIVLHSGRFHQIRVQFASRKHPLFGDGKYGAKDHEKRIHLCATHLGFNHPITKEWMEFNHEYDF